MEWLDWEDLTEEEQEQATKSYASIINYADGIPEDEVDTGDIDCKNFERMEDGYIYVDI